MFDWNQWLSSSSRITPWEGPVNPQLSEGTLLVRSTYPWVSEGPFSNLVKLTPDFVEFLMNPERALPVDEPLLGLIDQGFEYTETFRILWEFRFRSREAPNTVPSLARAFKGWLRGRPLPFESQLILVGIAAGKSPDGPFQRLDHLLFLHTLAQQQRLLQHSVFAVIGLNTLLEYEPPIQKTRFSELYDLYLMASRWGRLGGNIKLVYEFSRTPEFLRALHEHCPRLETLLGVSPR